MEPKDTPQMTTRLTLTTAAAVLSATALSAQTLPEGFYLHGFAGANWLDDTTFSGSINGGQQTVDTDFDPGFGIGIAIGREIPQWSTDNIGTRIELELSYRDNDVDDINFTGNGPSPEANVSGDISSTSLFANVLFDFKQQGKWTPYAGLGLGVTRSDLDFSYGPGVRVSDDDTNFATQLIAGVAYELNDSTALTLDGRYSRAFDVSAPRFAPNGALTGNIEDDLDTFSLNVGVRFGF